MVTVDRGWFCRWPVSWRCDVQSLPGIIAGSWVASRRRFFSMDRAAFLEGDASGLFAFPLELRVALDLDPPFAAVLIGLGDCVEIWPEANYYIGLQLAAGTKDQASL
jgi:DNA-binding transcriptional regulator/RsmH inhibitor MraZ